MAPRHIKGIYTEREARRNRGGNLKEREESTWSSSPNRSEEGLSRTDPFPKNGRNPQLPPFYTRPVTSCMLARPQSAVRV